ncbi:MAG: agglutinin biogenesis protein MshI [Pseudomonadota bacterium]
MIFTRSSSAARWTVLAADAKQLRYVQGSATGKPCVFAFGEAELTGDGQGLARAVRELRISRAAHCATLLGASDYQIHLVEAPDVAAQELKSAMKWRLKDVIDFPVEEAGYDILDLPVDRHGPAHNHSVYAVAAKKNVLKACVDRFDKAGMPISVIDIPETAQRNVAALYESDGRGVGWLYFDESGGLLTVTYGGELYLARRLDITLTQLRESQAEARKDLFDRVLLELQRTLDNFERQFSFIVIGKVMVGPEPEETGLVAHLIANLETKVEAVDLRAVIDVPRGQGLDPDAQWRMFHLIGCSFRTGTPTQ